MTHAVFDRSQGSSVNAAGVMQGAPSQLQMCLLIITREATLWTASLNDRAFSKPAAARNQASALRVLSANQVDLAALMTTGLVDSSAEVPSKQLYGKGVCYCPATAMYIASLGNADDEDQNVTWLMTAGCDGSTIGRVSAVHVTSSHPTADSDADSASSADSAGLQHPDPESDAEHAVSGEEEEHDEEDGSDEGSTEHTTLPTVERSYAIPVLPVNRQEMQSPGLFLGVPSHGLPGLVATVFEPAHSDGGGCALVSQIQDMQVTHAIIVITLFSCCFSGSFLKGRQHFQLIRAWWLHMLLCSRSCIPTRQYCAVSHDMQICVL